MSKENKVLEVMRVAQWRDTHLKAMLRVYMNAQFVVDVEGRKTAVVLPIDDFRALVERLEELEDLRLLEERRSEPRIAISSLEELLAAVEAPHQPERP